MRRQRRRESRKGIEHIPLVRPEDVRYRIIRLIEQRPEITQRELASDLGISLGKVNYCLRALIDKGHIKLSKFQRRFDKSHYFYLLTPAGVQAKAAITLQFLRRKMDEYEQLRQEIETLSAELELNAASAVSQEAPLFPVREKGGGEGRA